MYRMACWIGVAVGLAGAAWGAEHDTTPLAPTPWPATMPRDYAAEPLTAADWVGPDGIIYPDWSWVGVHLGEPGQRRRGIPKVEQVAAAIPVELAGAGQGEAFTAALEAAVERAGDSGGGVIQLPAGTFTLTRPLLVRGSGVVLRGAGRGKAVEPGGRDDPHETRIQFNFAYGVEGEPAVKALTFPFHDRLTRDSDLCLYAQAFSPKASGAARQQNGKATHLHGFYVTLEPDAGKPFTFGIAKDYEERRGFDRFQHFRPAGPVNAVSIGGEDVFQELKNATQVTVRVRVVWKWKDKQGDEEVALEDSAEAGPFVISTAGFADLMPPGRRQMVSEPVTSAITFVGDGRTLRNTKAPLLADAPRGATTLRFDVESVEEAARRGLRRGAAARLFVYSSQPFARAIERDGGSGSGRDQMVTLAAVRPAPEGGVLIDIEQPLQFDFPFNEGEVDQWNDQLQRYTPTGDRSTWIEAFLPVEGCGVEDLVLEQTQDIWFHGIQMARAMNCWLRNVRVERAGRDPALLSGLMNEVRDCEFIDPRWANNTGGGSAYLHGGHFTLIDNIYARNCRHAPNFAGSTAGVFHHSRFSSSDMQWHMGFGRAHLMDNCSVDALKGTGSYGYAAFAQRNLADIHGPGMGPRNVIYRCDLIGPDGGIFLGGKSENPIILHNRVRAHDGAGLILRYHVFNAVILGNTFAVMNRFEPGVLFGDPDPSQSRLHRTKDRPKPLVHPGLGAANPGNDFLHNTIVGGNGELAQGSWRFDFARSPWRRSGGNVVLPWHPDPPMPQPAMRSVFLTQREHPGGFAHLRPRDTLYHAPAAPDAARNDGEPILQVNFRDRRGDRGDQRDHWRGEEPGTGWVSDLGEPFAQRTHDGRTLRFGWVGGTPDVFQEAHWSDEDFRYRTMAAWGSRQGDDLRPFGQWEQHRDLAWQAELPPGRYRVFLAAGSPRKPERFSWPLEQPLPFTQVNDFLLNDVPLRDPGQSDVRRDAFWAEVVVGSDGLLTLRPAPTAITPRVAFLQVYRAQ